MKTTNKEAIFILSLFLAVFLFTPFSMADDDDVQRELDRFGFGPGGAGSTTIRDPHAAGGNGIRTSSSSTKTNNDSGSGNGSGSSQNSDVQGQLDRFGFGQGGSESTTIRDPHAAGGNGLNINHQGGDDALIINPGPDNNTNGGQGPGNDPIFRGQDDIDNLRGAPTGDDLIGGGPDTLRGRGGDADILLGGSDGPPIGGFSFGDAPDSLQNDVLFDGNGQIMPDDFFNCNGPGCADSPFGFGRHDTVGPEIDGAQGPGGFTTSSDSLLNNPTFFNQRFNELYGTSPIQDPNESSL